MKKQKPPRIPAPLTEEQRQAKNQAEAVKRNQSTLRRLQNPSPPRPSKPCYVGQPHLVVGVCFSRGDRASAIVYDIQQHQDIKYVDVRELLTDESAEEHYRHFSSNPQRKGKRSLEQMRLEQYRLVERFYREQEKYQQRRAEAQKRGVELEDESVSNLGEYLDRLLAARIVEFAVKRQASSIVIPELGNIRESIECEVQAWVEGKFPGMKEVQQEYAKRYRDSFHSWSYGRLGHCLRSRAARDGLAIEVGQQPRQGTLPEKALAVVQSAIVARQAASQ